MFSGPTVDVNGYLTVPGGQPSAIRVLVCVWRHCTLHSLNNLPNGTFLQSTPARRITVSWCTLCLAEVRHTFILFKGCGCLQIPAAAPNPTFSITLRSNVIWSRSPPNAWNIPVSLTCCFVCSIAVVMNTNAFFWQMLVVEILLTSL